ncbi:MAG: DUF2442 domain-containing protein [Opitutales bacterium]
MNSLAVIEREPAASKIEVTEDELIVFLVDGRRICVPLAWYPRLFHGSMAERNDCELMGRGTGIHWPQLDEDISVSGMLRGNPSFESDQSLQRWLSKRQGQQAGRGNE